MNRYFKLIIILFCFLFLNTCRTYGAPTARNPIEWLNELETEVRGNITDSSLFDRLSQFESLLTGRIVDDRTLIDRLARLETLLYLNQPHDICLLFKLQALEWILYREGFSGPMLPRLEKMEELVFKQTFPGPVTKRLERLVNQIFPGGTIKAKWVSVPEGLLVKVRTVDELSSLKSKAGDEFKFVIAETVTMDRFVLFPKGSGGTGILQKVKKPGSLGRDARLLLHFSEVRALDGTFIKISSGSKSSELNRSYQLAVGASAAGMLIFGPEGILFGLAVKGKERTIPPGTEFYLQVKESTRIYTLEDDRG